VTQQLVESIDAVITWVDGSDPQLAAKLEAYLASLGGSARPRSASAARFHNSDEIDYCIVSLLRYAPWIRRIYVVTDAQRPAILTRLANTQFAERVQLVDHKEIFAGYEEFLPTFNIRSIMTMLWRIPGLANNFIFLNDDFALVQPVSPADFFRDGKVVLRGHWVSFSERRWPQRLKAWWRQLRGQRQAPEQQRVRHLAAQELSAKLAGFEKKYYQLEHNPHPWRVATSTHFFAQQPHLLQRNIAYRLRSAEQFITECLMAQLELKLGGAIEDNRLRTLQLKPAEQSLLRTRRKLAKAERDARYAFVCVQNFEQAAPDTQRAIIEWLDRHVGTLEQLLSRQAPL